MLTLTDIIGPTQDWWSEAICAQADPDEWFPERGGAPATRAKAICSTCPVKQQCLDYALEHGETWGVWGGKSPKERRAMRRNTHRIAS